MDMPSPKCKKEFQSSLGMINCLSKFLQATVEVCELLRKFTSVKAEWCCNGTYQDLFDKVQRLITMDTWMKHYDTLKPLSLEREASGIGLVASLLQI